MKIEIRLTKTPKIKTAHPPVGFGKSFTDHMFLMDYTKESGWHNARIQPFGPIPVHPAATVLHYGSEVFEGLKAYRRPDGGVQLFSPLQNAARLNRSAERLCLPQIPTEDFLEIIKTLVRVERDWVPSEKGTSLYLRPFLFGNDEALGVHAVQNATFAVIASPVGSYYPGGLAPVKILIEDEDVRAVRGGTGAAKCGGNYAASTRAGQRAESLGYAQVLWLDGVERRYIEEVGAMNVMFKIDEEILTPALSGSILAGVTRSSCIALLREKGYSVSERRISVEELCAAMESGRLREAWGCGTAAVVSPIGEFYYKGRKYPVGDGGIGAVTSELYETLTAIQWGYAEDPFGWTMPID